eukprot:7634731-Karenia_brevis.AAC.1
MSNRTNGLKVADKQGVHSVRSVRRLPVQRRWSDDTLEWTGWVPLHEYKDAREAYGDIPEGVTVEERGRP